MGIVICNAFPNKANRCRCALLQDFRTARSIWFRLQQRLCKGSFSRETSHILLKSNYLYASASHLSKLSERTIFSARKRPVLNKHTSCFALSRKTSLLVSSVTSVLSYYASSVRLCEYVRPRPCRPAGGNMADDFIAVFVHWPVGERLLANRVAATWRHP